MKTLTQYQCEICNTVFSDSGSATKCEASHTVADEVHRYKYYPYTNGSSKYPYAVIVKMQDGTYIEFKR